MNAFVGRTEPVLLVCPDLRPSVLQVARALQAHDQLRGFVTSLALPRGAAASIDRLRLPALRRAFGSRVVPEWLAAPTELVWQHELVHQLARRARVSERWTHELWRWAEPAFDARVARRWAGRVPCIYGIENASVETFEAQRARGGLNLLWQVIAHPRTLEQIEREQMRRFPQARDAYARVQERDAQWVRARKERQYAAAHRIICNSAFVRDSFMQAGVEPERLMCVPTPCPKVAHHSVATPDTAPRIVLFAGHLSLRKGVPGLLQAFAQLSPELGAELWLAGKALLPERMLADLPPRVRLLGALPRSELSALMRRASLFVLPTLAEGRSHAVLEALAHGLPCVTTHASGCSDLVIDGETGYLVPPDDPEALVARIYQCLRDPERLRTMAGHCLARARAWDEQAFARAHHAALADLLPGR